MENGLVDGKLILTDSTHVKANASKKSEAKAEEKAVPAKPPEVGDEISGRLYQNYLCRKASGKQREYEERIKAKKKVEKEAKNVIS